MSAEIKTLTRVPPPRCDPGQRPVYNPGMTVFRYGREHFEEVEYVRRTDATPGDDLDPAVRIVEGLGAVAVPGGRVRAAHGRDPRRRPRPRGPHRGRFGDGRDPVWQGRLPQQLPGVYGPLV